MTLTPTPFYLLFLVTVLSHACKETTQQIPPHQKQPPIKQEVVRTPPQRQVAEYIRNIHQDKQGHFWMGTNGYGVAHYNGDSLVYYSNAQGFSGEQITGIAEDPNGNLWFATNLGVVQYTWATMECGEKRFVNHTDFNEYQFWSICADSQGAIWAGSAKGIYRYNGHLWVPFELPYPKIEKGDFITSTTTWSIVEDSQGRMWFSTNGYGIYVWDGKTFTHYDQEDGLVDNSVDVILEDSNAHMWIGTRYGGVSRYNGKTFTSYNQQNDSIGNNEVCAIYEDSKGNIWMSSEGYGVYRYDRIAFSNYRESDGLGVKAVQTIYEDKDGRIWAGGGGGLFRFEEGRFVNVTREGPW